MFGLDQTIAKIIAGIVLVLGIFLFGYYQGHSAVQAKFDKYKAEVQAAADEQAKESAKIDARNAKLFKDAQNAYNNSLANLRSYYSLRYGKSGSTMPQVPSTPAGADGYSPDNLPPASVLAGQCAETTLNLIALQSWIRATNP